MNRNDVYRADERKRRPIVYLSGAVTGNKWARTMFSAAESILDSRGYECINPQSIGALFPQQFKHSDYMDVDYVLLSKADYIAMIPGYETSKGAMLELNFAKEHGIGILEGKDGYLPTVHPKWKDSFEEVRENAEI